MIKVPGIRSFRNSIETLPRMECAVLAALLLAAAPAVAYEKEIDELAAAMTTKIASAGKGTVAVVDFTDLNGSVTELGRFLAEELSAALAGAGSGFEIVDRTHLKSILQEHKLAATGIIDPATARQLGKIAGVDALVTGTLTSFGDSVRVAAKVLDTASAKVLSAERVNLPRLRPLPSCLVQESEAVANPQRLPQRRCCPRRQPSSSAMSWRSSNTSSGAARFRARRWCVE